MGTYVCGEDLVELVPASALDAGIISGDVFCEEGVVV